MFCLVFSFALGYTMRDPLASPMTDCKKWGTFTCTWCNTSITAFTYDWFNCHIKKIFPKLPMICFFFSGLFPHWNLTVLLIVNLFEHFCVYLFGWLVAGLHHARDIHLNDRGHHYVNMFIIKMEYKWMYPHPHHCNVHYYTSLRFVEFHSAI